MSGNVAFEFGRTSTKRKLAVHEKDDDFQVEYLKEVDHEAFNEQTPKKDIKPIPLQPDTSQFFKRHKPSRYLPTSIQNQISNEEKFEKPILDDQYNQQGDKKEEKLNGYGLQIRKPKNLQNQSFSNDKNFLLEQKNGDLTENFRKQSDFIKQNDNFRQNGQHSQIDRIIEEKLKDDLRDLPSAPDEKNYSNVAVEDFGRALLMGMGWNPNKEKNQNQVIVPDKRPDRLGLGAKPEDLQKKQDKKFKQSEKINQDSKNNTNNTDKKPEKEQNSKQKSQINGPSEFTQNNNIQKQSKYTEKNQISEKYKNTSPDKNTDKFKQNQQQQPNWLYNGIRVKIINKNIYEQFYLCKGVVSDVFERGVCDVHLDSGGQILQNIKQENLETVVPRNKGAKILVVGGQFKGQSGEFLKRDDNQGIAAVLLDDVMEVVKLGFDDIAECVGLDAT